MAPDEAQQARLLPASILRVMEVGRGSSSHRWTVEDLSQALTEHGIEHTPDQLSDALARLADCGHLVRVQRQPYSVYPLHFVRQRQRPFDPVDRLSAEVCAALRRRDERFEDEEQLRVWLVSDGVEFDGDVLDMALAHLERIGRLRRPRADQWRSDSPLPGLYVGPRTYHV